MGRAERRAAERKVRQRGESEPLKGSKFVIYAIVAFAMVFSSLGMILAYGGRGPALICLAVAVVVALGIYMYIRFTRKAEEQPEQRKDTTRLKKGN